MSVIGSISRSIQRQKVVALGAPEAGQVQRVGFLTGQILSIASFVAQALVEGITLLTPDAVVASYPAPVRAV